MMNIQVEDGFALTPQEMDALTERLNIAGDGPDTEWPQEWVGRRMPATNGTPGVIDRVYSLDRAVDGNGYILYQNRVFQIFGKWRTYEQAIRITVED